MIKIVTALGNPSLNYELKKYSEFEIIGNDIQYMDGIVEVLDQNPDIDYIIISEVLDGQISLTNLIDIIYKINKKIKIIVVLNEKNVEIEDSLMRKGIHDILYNKTDIIEIVNLLKTRNIEILNKELRDEIENLKSIIVKKNNKKIFNKKINSCKKINKCKVIGITGNKGIGKTSFSVFLANQLKKKYRILIIDLDFVNSDINIFYKRKDAYIESEIFYLKNYITTVNNNLDVITGFNYLFNSKKVEMTQIKSELNKIKSNYDYIIIDTYSEPTFLENKMIFNLCDYLLFLTGINNLEIKKSQRLLNIINKNLDVDNKKIHIVLYKYKLIDYIIFRRFKYNNVFRNMNIIGKIKYLYFNNLYINNNFKYVFFNINIKKFCKSLINKLNGME